MPYQSSQTLINHRSAYWEGGWYPTHSFDQPLFSGFDPYGHIPVYSDVIYRAGDNAPFFIKGKTVYLPHIIMVKKKVGLEYKDIRRYRWVNSGTGKPRREYYIQRVSKPVYAKVPKKIYRASKLLTPENVLIAPNHLDFRLSKQVTMPGYSKVQWHYRKSSFNNFKGSVIITDMMKTSPVYQPTDPDFSPSGWGTAGNMAINGANATAIGGNFPSDPFQLASSFHPDDILSCQNAARSALYKKVKNEFPDFALMLAESGESLRTLKSILRKGIALVFALKRLDLKRLAGRTDLTASSISSQWLEFVYGVMPVVRDIGSTLDLVNRETRSWRKYSTSREIHMSDVVPFSSGSLTGTNKVVRRYQYKCSVIMDGYTFHKDLAKKTGFDSNPFDTVYQVVPFSFMLDWLIDIGGYLSSSDILNSGVLHYWETSIVEDESEIRAEHAPYGDFVSIVGPAVTHRENVFRCNRQVFNTPPAMPEPSLSLGNAFSSSRALNALAIFITRNSTTKQF